MRDNSRPDLKAIESHKNCVHDCQQSNGNSSRIGGALPSVGFVRLASIIGPGGPIPVSKSTWWAGVKSGRYPKPVKLGPRITAWRVEDIRALIQAGASS